MGWVSEQREPGETLIGGMTRVTRVGGKVYRTAGPWTPTIHRLLRHLRSRGIRELPEPFGSTAEGEEVLSYLAGVVPHYPMPDWVWDDRLLTELARLLRRVHDAGADLDHRDAVWQLPPREPGEVICHQDAAPYNVAVLEPTSEGEAPRLVGIIDWDTAAPGPRVWDLAYVGYRWAHLQDARSGEVADLTVEQRRDRLDLICAEYGRPDLRAGLVEVAIERVHALLAFTRERQQHVAQPNLASHLDIYEQDLAWIDRHRRELG